MKHIGRTSLALALAVGAFGVTGALAGNGDMDQLKLQLKDGSCVDSVATATSPDAIKDQVQLKAQLKDGSCLDSTATAQSAVKK